MWYHKVLPICLLSRGYLRLKSNIKMRREGASGQVIFHARAIRPLILWELFKDTKIDITLDFGSWFDPHRRTVIYYGPFRRHKALYWLCNWTDWLSWQVGGSATRFSMRVGWFNFYAMHSNAHAQRVAKLWRQSILWLDTLIGITQPSSAAGITKAQLVWMNHLCVGYTNNIASVLNIYWHQYFPMAISTANAVNSKAPEVWSRSLCFCE